MAAAPVVTGGAAAGTTEFAASQAAARESALGLTAAVELENTAFGKQATILGVVTAEQEAEATISKSSAAAHQSAALALAAQARASAGAGVVAAKLATAEEAAALTTGRLAASRAVLRVSSAAVAIGENELNVALKTKNVALIDAAAQELNLARAEEVQATAAVKAAIAENELAASAARSGASHAQATRGLVAETLALGGLRGATLAASAPFLVGATAAIVFAKSIKEASSETEELNKTAVVFGSSAQQIDDFSKTTARSLGISSTEALKAAGVFGNLFRTIKISEPVSADMSERLVKLASDLASFNNADPTRTLEALRSGLVGQARPLRVFGIFLSAARVQQEALIETQKKSAKELTQSELVVARYNLILRDSNLAAGDFARTSDRLANQARIAKAQLSDLGVQIGTLLIPPLLNLVTDVNNAITALHRLSAVKIKLPGADKGSSFDRLRDQVERVFGKTGTRTLELNALFPGLGFSVQLWGDLGKALKAAAGNTNEATKAMSGFHFAIGGLPAEIAAMQAAADKLDLSNINTQLKSLEFGQLNIQTGLAPGGRAAEESNLKKQIEDQLKIVKATATGTKARRDALVELKSKQDELASLEQQDASDAQARAQKIKAAAAKRKAAVREAARAQQEAAQEFIAQFAPKQQRLQNVLSNASQFGNVRQQIAANKAILAADQAEIKAIKQYIAHKKLHGDALKTALAAIATIKQDEFNTRQAIRQLTKPDPQALFAFQTSHLEAALSIAETTKGTKDDQRALKAIIAHDNARIAALKKIRHKTLEEKTELDNLRVDLAQRNKALHDLQGTVDDANKAAAKFFFSQLQAQQGFASNLLGNLITGSTAGLVGVPSPAKAAGAIPEDRIASERTRQQAKTTPGPTAGQHQTTNDILIRILHALTRQNRTDQAPEAHHQRRVGAAIMDNDGIHGI